LAEIPAEIAAPKASFAEIMAGKTPENAENAAKARKLIGKSSGKSTEPGKITAVPALFFRDLAALSHPKVAFFRPENGENTAENGENTAENDENTAENGENGGSVCFPLANFVAWWQWHTAAGDKLCPLAPWAATDTATGDTATGDTATATGGTTDTGGTATATATAMCGGCGGRRTAAQPPPPGHCHSNTTTATATATATGNTATATQPLPPGHCHCHPYLKDLHLALIFQLLGRQR
jgi:hypothetical protein